MLYYLSVQNIGWVVMFIYLFNSMLYFQILTSVRTRALVTPMLLVRIVQVITHVLVCLVILEMEACVLVCMVFVWILFEYYLYFNYRTIRWKFCLDIFDIPIEGVNFILENGINKLRKMICKPCDKHTIFN